MTNQNTIPGVQFLQVMHDNDCPKLSGGECQCTPEARMVDKETFVAAYAQDRKQRRAAAREAEKAIRRAARPRSSTR
jgi:hypothetical protein